MRRATLCFVLVLSLAPATQARVWSDAAGQKQVDAEFIKVESGKAILKLQNGQFAGVALDKLSAADRVYVEDQIAKAKGHVPASQIKGDDRFSNELRKDPSNPGAWTKRGLARSNQGKYEEAISDFSQALKIAPNYAEAMDARGQAFAKSGDPVKAHNDFNNAIEINPDLATAYRHRADNMIEFSKTNEGKDEFNEMVEDYRKKVHNARKSNMRNTAWQPLNSTAGPVTAGGMIGGLASADRKYADEIERRYRGGDGGGAGGHAHGSGCQCAGCAASCAFCEGGGCAQCQGTLAPPLAVYPQKVEQGKTIQLVANPSTMQAGMPQKVGPGAPKPRSFGSRRRAAKGGKQVEVAGVDFYRDADMNGALDPTKDQYLASDEDGKDGFTAKVSTENFPPGPQGYFATPKGAAGTGTAIEPAELKSAVDALTEAAKMERAIAKESSAAAKSSGLEAAAAASLDVQQDSIRDTAKDVYEKIKAGAPELAAELAKAGTPMKAVGNLMDAAKRKPGEASKQPASAASEKATLAAEKMESLAEKLAKMADDESYAENTVTGKPAVARNEITPAMAKAGGTGGGDGGGGDNGDDDNGGRGDDGYDDDDVIIRDDDDDVIIRDDDDVIVDRALDYIDDRDYDSALVEYDDLLERYPDDYVYTRDRAGVYLADGRYNYAVRDYNNLITTEPSADLFYNRGCAYLALGNVKEAIADFTRSIELDETRNLAWTNRGVSYARSGDFKNAATDFEAALKLNPNDVLAYKNRSLCFRKMGLTDKADADLEMIRSLTGG